MLLLRGRCCGVWAASRPPRGAATSHYLPRAEPPVLPPGEPSYFCVLRRASLCPLLSLFLFVNFTGIFREEGESNLLFHFRMHSLVDSCMCPDWGQTHNLGLWGGRSNQLIHPARASLFLSFSPCQHLPTTLQMSGISPSGSLL